MVLNIFSLIFAINNLFCVIFGPIKCNRRLCLKPALLKDTMVEKINYLALYLDPFESYLMTQLPIWVGFPRTGIYPDICHFFENVGGLLWPYLIS